jgi:hypothetical protein
MHSYLHPVNQELVLELQAAIDAEYDFLGAWKQAQDVLKGLGRPRSVYVRPLDTDNSDDEVEEGVIYCRRRRSRVERSETDAPTKNKSKTRIIQKKQFVLPHP